MDKDFITFLRKTMSLNQEEFGEKINFSKVYEAILRQGYVQ